MTNGLPHPNVELPPRIIPGSQLQIEQSRKIQENLTALAVASGNHNAVSPVVNIIDAGARSGHVSTEAIQAAINKAGKLESAVYIPRGEFWTDQLLIPSNVMIFGTGWQSILKLIDSSANPYMLTNVDHTNGNSNIRLCDFAINANKATQSTAEVVIEITCNDAHRNENIFIERIYEHDSHGLGIINANSRRFAVRDCLIENNNRDGTSCYENSSIGLISGNEIIGCSDDSIGLNSENGKSEGHLLEDIVVANNVIIGPGANMGSYGAIHARGGQNISIVGNVIDAVKEYGIVAEDYNKTGVGGLLIADNSLKQIGLAGENERPAISLYAGINGEGGMRDVSITGNRIREPATYGIFLQNLKGGSDPVEGINISDNHIDHAGLTGIHLADGVIKDVAIHDNLIHDCTERGIAAITATTNLQRIWVNGNTTYNNGEAGIYLKKVVGGSCVGNVSYNQVGEAPQKYGIILKEVTNNWSRGANLAYDNEVENYAYEMPGATIATITN